MNAAEILRELVAIPTPSAVSNLPLLEWVSGFVATRGWEARLLPYTDENRVAKGNLIVRPKGVSFEAPIDIAFVCHTDTVPYAESWADALNLRRTADEPVLHGCGACDVKGSLACFLAAMDEAGTGGVKPDIAMILSADEEIGCRGDGASAVGNESAHPIRDCERADIASCGHRGKRLRAGKSESARCGGAFGVSG